LRQANEILRKESTYFAQAELDRPFTYHESERIGAIFRDVDARPARSGVKARGVRVLSENFGVYPDHEHARANLSVHTRAP
jgi:hypothetical protein